MYLLDNHHSTELLRERQELLAREARFARELRAARREERSTSGPRTARSAGRVIALWRRTSVSFFRA